ncbi:hypothetical protein G4B88_018334 [Cannabis sativa]|uniref:UBX domain-containing protein n=1 Tax=Cannabis sativa TaxID=3483 RepID=A0A7J6EWL2_CANSA|nr:hypothetical protein G4B88_018334 [Cannabis sativa]
MDFVASFEHQYGFTHPCFYTCHFMEALEIAKVENKFLFMYLHSPQHPFTSSFCRETLCSELTVECILIPILFVGIEGPISPAELVEILQRTMEEQGLAFGCSKAMQQQKIRAHRRLREQQLQLYRLTRLKNLALRDHRVQKPAEAAKRASYTIKPSTISREIQSNYKQALNTGKDPQATQILIRLSNGERREQRFSSIEKVQSIYRFIDSLRLHWIGNYRLVSSFPRKIYGVDQMGQTLKDAGLRLGQPFSLKLFNTNL